MKAINGSLIADRNSVKTHQKELAQNKDPFVNAKQ
jgi:hypothetical protein